MSKAIVKIIGTGGSKVCSLNLLSISSIEFLLQVLMRGRMLCHRVMANRCYVIVGSEHIGHSVSWCFKIGHKLATQMGKDPFSPI